MFADDYDKLIEAKPAPLWQRIADWFDRHFVELVLGLLILAIAAQVAVNAYKRDAPLDGLTQPQVYTLRQICTQVEMIGVTKEPLQCSDCRYAMSDGSKVRQDGC